MVGRSFADHLVDRRSFVIRLHSYFGHTRIPLLAVFAKRCARSALKSEHDTPRGFANARSSQPSTKAVPAPGQEQATPYGALWLGDGNFAWLGSGPDCSEFGTVPPLSRSVAAGDLVRGSSQPRLSRTLVMAAHSKLHSSYDKSVAVAGRVTRTCRLALQGLASPPVWRPASVAPAPDQVCGTYLANSCQPRGSTHPTIATRCNNAAPMTSA
jgi:hypothetical protein